MHPTHLHFDCYSGISGDMTLGALVDLGVRVEELESRLKALAIGPFALRAERVKRQGIMGTKLHVEVDEEDREGARSNHEHHGHEHAQAHGHGHPHGHHGPEHGHGHHHDHHNHGETHHAHSGHSHEHAPAPTPHAHAHDHHGRRLADVLEILNAAALPERVSRRAARAYRKLAEAEARVHGSTPDSIHFHEVGAKDAIVDVAGAMLGLELLGIETFSASTVTVGFGTVRCHHGTMPVPAPATAELLKGLPQAPGPIQAEMVTPTGAAILATLLEESGVDAARERVVEALGYGAGNRTYDGYANFLRLALCQATTPAASTIKAQAHTVALLETEIDDMSPEVAGYLLDRLLEDGAFDVQFSPVQMKKNRPALRLRVLCEPDAQARLAERLFRETSTFGIRHQTLERWCLERRIETVETPLGLVAVKLGFWGEEILKAAPEYESCRALAQAKGVPLAEAYAQAHEAVRRRFGLGSGA